MMILGSMGELGDVSREEHAKIIRMITDNYELRITNYENHPDGNSEFGIRNSELMNTVWLVGSEFAAVKHPFRQFADVEEVKAAIKAEQPQGKYILIKGSNSQKLFQLPELL